MDGAVSAGIAALILDVVYPLVQQRKIKVVVELEQSAAPNPLN
jgi:hypothetical protein